LVEEGRGIQNEAALELIAGVPAFDTSNYGVGFSIELASPPNAKAEASSDVPRIEPPEFIEAHALSLWGFVRPRR
jgi:hypothetical protein